MALYASVAELASYLQQDVDTSTATLVLETASALFATAAQTAFTATTVTYEVRGTGQRELWLPYRPIISITQARVAGVIVTDYTRIKRVLFRLLGWGVAAQYPPDLVAIDLVHGYAAAADDVKGAVLETAASAFVSPDNATVGEKIDDYTVRQSSGAGGMQLSKAASALALMYRGAIVM